MVNLAASQDLILFITIAGFLTAVVLIFAIATQMFYRVQKKPISPLYVNVHNTNAFELEVHRRLKKIFGSNRLFLNYMFGEGDSSCQIDHIAISNKAIFVLESKDYKGVIKGDTNELNWVQQLNYVKQTPSKYVSYSKYGRPYRRTYLKEMTDKHAFYNPVKQNAGHIATLKTKLDIANVPIVNIVVFSDRASLLIKRNNEEDMFVVKADRLMPIINRYLDTHEKVLDERGLNYLEGLLLCLNTNSDENQQRHVERLQTNHNHK